MANTIKSGILKGAQYKKTANNEIQKVHLETDSDQVLVDNGESSLTTALSVIRSGLSNLSSAVTDLSDTVQALPDNNTTYSFSGGTDKFTVTPSGGSAQDVTITTNLAGSNLSGKLPISKGGTGATDAPGARSALGLGSAATYNAGSSATNVPVLDSNAKLPISTIPDAVLGQLLFGGTLSVCSTNTPGENKNFVTLSSNAVARLGNGATTDARPFTNTGETAAWTEGMYFLVSNNGYFVGSSGDNPGSIEAKVGDWIVSTGSKFVKIDNTDAVTSVNGKDGPVVLTLDDIGDGTNKKWADKQNALTAQTAYSAKGTATKVPQITTNNLGQVTGITEVNITFPADANTWRPVKYGSTTLSDSSSTLEFAAGTGISLGFTSGKLTITNSSPNAATSRTVTVGSGVKANGSTAISATSAASTGNLSVTLGDSGVTAGTYSAIQVNAKGIAVAGAYSIKYATSTDADISDLVVGGTLFVVS